MIHLKSISRSPRSLAILLQPDNTDKSIKCDADLYKAVNQRGEAEILVMDYAKRESVKQIVPAREFELTWQGD